jgi:hypothetical protein
VVTLLGDLMIGCVLLALAAAIFRFGSPLALPRAAVRAVFPSRFSEETHARAARFQDKSLAACVGLLGVVFIVGGFVVLLGG